MVDCFRATAVFEMAGYSVVERVAATSRLIDVDPGAVVIVQGAAATTVHVIEAGRLHVTVDSARDTRTVNEMGPGDWFGEIGVVGQRPRTATVVAETAARWSIPGPTFLDAMASSATVADRLGQRSTGSPRSHQPGTGGAMNVAGARAPRPSRGASPADGGPRSRRARRRRRWCRAHARRRRPAHRQRPRSLLRLRRR